MIKVFYKLSKKVPEDCDTNTQYLFIDRCIMKDGVEELLDYIRLPYEIVSKFIHSNKELGIYDL